MQLEPYPGQKKMAEDAIAEYERQQRSPDGPFRDAVYEAKTAEANVIIKKQADYGPRSVAEAPGGPLNGLLVRIHDKKCRLDHLILSGKAANNEALRDTAQDLANYATILTMVLDGSWPNGNHTTESEVAPGNDAYSSGASSV